MLLLKGLFIGVIFLSPLAPSLTANEAANFSFSALAYPTSTIPVLVEAGAGKIPTKQGPTTSKWYQNSRSKTT
jgi:hypothetical protein